MNIVVPTIQHTGTGFVTKLLIKKFNHASLGDKYRDRDTVFIGHIVKQEQVLFAKEKLKACICIVPLRHPFVVWESWKRQGDTDFDYFRQGWMNLVEQIDPYNPYYLPLDVDDRKSYLDLINTQTGLELKTDWEPVDSVAGTFNLKYIDIRPDERLFDLVNNLRGFLDRFYGH
jgi:hypothetical protein